MRRVVLLVGLGLVLWQAVYLVVPFTASRADCRPAVLSMWHANVHTRTAAEILDLRSAYNTYAAKQTTPQAQAFWSGLASDIPATVSFPCARAAKGRAATHGAVAGVVLLGTLVAWLVLRDAARPRLPARGVTGDGA